MTTCGRERGPGGGVGAESYDCKKAWSSINHSILSALSPVPPPSPNAPLVPDLNVVFCTFVPYILVSVVLTVYVPLNLFTLGT